MADEIFEGKTFQDLTKDIYNNANQKKKQIEILIKEMNKMVTTIDDVVMLAPIIKEYLEVGVKNDEHLVKLASVLQRIFSKSKVSDEDTSLLSEHEKQELMDSLQNTIDEIQNESDSINEIKQKYEN
tara:strand:- start:8686 stop:9066 length:381 start_codon:yes stop_codon:yes gene_type:complete